MPSATAKKKSPAKAGAKPSSKQSKLHFLIHDQTDDVGVAVIDIESGEQVSGLTLDKSRQAVAVKAIADIPLGHKIALRDFKKGDTITKYGQDIGKVVAPIRKGDHVHVHNVKTKRW
jgi:(2R)-sulfolactate sulfo-lyase subunit alpha